MKKTLFVAIAALLSISTVFAQTPAATTSGKSATATAAPAASTSCEAKAVGKNGKPLAGAAKTAFLKKCEDGTTSTTSATCESKAVGKNGKPLAGAAKTSFMKKCEADAGK